MSALPPLTQVQAEINEVRKIVGGTITAAIHSDDDYFGFRIRLRDGSVKDVWINCNPEGNAPGHLAIEAANLVAVV